MSDPFDEVSLLVEEAVRSLLPWRRTFTEREALSRVWEAGYEVSIQTDARFVLAQEGIGKHPRHWRLDSHTLANNRLLNDLVSGSWDGRDLEGKLAELDTEDQRHYVYCPTDPRLEQNRQGVLEPAERERNVTLPRATREELAVLGPLLLARWQESSAEPWTVRAITEALKELGWREAEQHNAWLLVRSWLLGWPQVQRVGQDYWIPADQLPQETKHARLQVLPVRTPEPEDTIAKEGTSTREAVATSRRTSAVSTDASRVVLSGEVTAQRAAWSERLRTINLLEGFLHIPASARGVYPIPARGESDTVVLAGRWFEDGSRCWLWLDRARHRLYGPALAEKLAWLEAGDMLHIEWAPDIIVLRMAGHDSDVQIEEARLVDLGELATLRGGLGESYRFSLQAILQDAPAGLTFAEVVKAIRERQHHNIHRGTIRALLYSGGFVQKDRRWFPAPDSKMGARQLREAMVETLVQEEPDEQTQALSPADFRRKRIKAIHKRLEEIITSLR
jgi:hypothetical protein